GVMLLAFLTGVPIAVVAIGGAAYCLVTRRVKPEKVYREVNWGLLVLFVGLFVLWTAWRSGAGAAPKLAGKLRR
ncbi:MAG TPA: SLC13 family permease, partial [Methylomirabilota bacterium]|nr:SLC13 family permease [Methylomirabilota bacterium]